MPEVLSKVVSLGEQLKHELAGEGHVPGQRFYSLPEVSERYGVSPATAYKAVSRLVVQGYLRSQRRKGYFVQRKPDLGHTVRRQTAAAMMVVVGDRSGGARVVDQYMRALKTACEAAELQLLVVNNDSREIEQASENKRLVGHLFYGLSRAPDVKFDPTRVMAYNCTWADPASSLLSADREQISRLAFEHLWDLGHQHTAMVRLTPGGSLADEEMGRVLGMRKAYGSMGLQWRPEDVITIASKDGREIDGDAAEGLYERLVGQGITGVHCISWPVLMELYRQAHRRGRRIGQELSVIIHGGHDAAELLDPRPARVWWRFADFASTVMRAIRCLEKGEAPAHRLWIPVFLQTGPSARPLIARTDELPGGPSR